MKLFLYVLFIFYLLIGCNSKETTKESLNSQRKAFLLNGKIDKTTSNFAYLNRVEDNSFVTVDSTEIKDNAFIFKGSVNFPERFVITFDNSSEYAMLIIENTTFSIRINSELVQEPIIENSKLNSELGVYKKRAQTIFKKIDYLYPHFQKARLENNNSRLKEIGVDIANIEKEFQEFTFKYIEENNKSYVSAMVLRDLLKSSKADTVLLKKLYFLLSPEVQKCPDAVLIASTLNLN